jgi:hypothetical protein
MLRFHLIDFWAFALNVPKPFPHKRNYSGILGPRLSTFGAEGWKIFVPPSHQRAALQKMDEAEGRKWAAAWR